MCVQNKCEKHECFSHWVGYRKKCNGHSKSSQKRSISFKNAWLALHFMLWNGKGHTLLDVVPGCEQKEFGLYFSESIVATILFN